MTMEQTLDRFNWQAWLIIHQTRDVLTQFRGEELSKYGITVAQAWIMTGLAFFKGEATIDGLSKLLLRKHHTISTALTRMEEKGLIHKNRGLHTNGRYIITLTEKGKQAYEEVQRGESIHELMSCLSKEELIQLSQLLKRIWARALELDASKSGLFIP